MDSLQIQSLPGGRDGIRILKLQGPFTLQSSLDFQSIAREPNAPPVTIIDLTDVPYMDSAALGCILGVHVSCQREGRRYAIAGASDRLKTLFKVAGVDSLLISYPSVSEAEAQLAEASSKSAAL